MPVDNPIERLVLGEERRLRIPRSIRGWETRGSKYANLF